MHSYAGHIQQGDLEWYGWLEHMNALRTNNTKMIKRLPCLYFAGVKIQNTNRGLWCVLSHERPIVRETPCGICACTQVVAGADLVWCGDSNDLALIHQFFYSSAYVRDPCNKLDTNDMVDDILMQIQCGAVITRLFFSKIPTKDSP